MKLLSFLRHKVWIARIFSISFAVFLSLFALDVFSENYGFWKTVVAILIHLIPSFIVISVLILAWNREWLGGIAFLLLGVFHLVSKWGSSHWTNYMIISFPLILLGIIYLISWYQRRIQID